MKKTNTNDIDANVEKLDNSRPKIEDVFREEMKEIHQEILKCESQETGYQTKHLPLINTKINAAKTEIMFCLLKEIKEINSKVKKERREP